MVLWQGNHTMYIIDIILSVSNKHGIGIQIPLIFKCCSNSKVYTQVGLAVALLMPGATRVPKTAMGFGYLATTLKV